MIKIHFILSIALIIGLYEPARAQTVNNPKTSKVSFAEGHCAKLGKIENATPFPWKKVASGKPIPKEWITDKYQSSLGSPGEFRWFSEKGTSETYLERSEDGKNFFAPPIPLSSCSTETNGSFTLFNCAASVLLYNGRNLVSVSVEDYSAPQVEFVEKLTFNKQDAVLIAVGIKAGKAWYLIPKDFGKFEPQKCFEKKELLD